MAAVLLLTLSVLTILSQCTCGLVGPPQTQPDSSQVEIVSEDPVNIDQEIYYDEDDIEENGVDYDEDDFDGTEGVLYDEEEDPEVEDGVIESPGYFEGDIELSEEEIEQYYGNVNSSHVSLLAS